MVKQTGAAIIGGGMAGCMAALSAARAGMDVLVLRQSHGATALSSGAVDLAGTDRWLQRVMEPGFPVEAAIDQAVSGFLQWTAKAGCPYTGGRQAGLILGNSLGTFKQTQLAPLSLAAGNLNALKDARILFVGIQGYADYNAALAGRSLRLFSQRGLTGAVFETDSVQVEFPVIRHPANLTAFEIAGLLDREGTVLEFANRIREKANPGDYTHIALPAVAGLHRPLQALAALEESLGRPCFELAAAPPSVPGYRLQAALDQALQVQGIPVLHARVESFSASAGRIERIFAVEKEVHYEVAPEAVVLASGKFIGGGIAWTDRLHEPIFNLPVCVDGVFDLTFGIRAVLSDRFAGEQKIFAAGLKVDAQMRPVGPDGRVLYSNLLAAGAVTAGYNYTQGDGGLGIPLVAGSLAGQFAARCARPEGALA